MTQPDGSCILEDVPPIQNLEYPDILADALAVALCYRDEGIYERSALLRAYQIRPGHRAGVYSAISTLTGRGWLIGFDEASYAGERHDVLAPQPSFAVAGLASYLEHYETILDAIHLMDHEPQLLWNREGALAVDPQQAAGFVGVADTVDAETVRRYVIESIAGQGRPVIALLDLPGALVVELALLTGYEAAGEVILGRSPYQNPLTDNSAPYGYFRLADWERRVVALIGVGPERPTEWDRPYSYIAMEKALRYAASHTRGTQHNGLAAYDAWERALLADELIDGVDDEIVSHRLLYHSAIAGTTASQKAFTVLPNCYAPSMDVIGGLMRRAAAGTGMIHGLMWDVWHVVGGYWLGAKPVEGHYLVRWENDDELRRFRDRAVRERAAGVIRRARQVDAQSLQDLQLAQEEWDYCRGRGKDYPCPCMDKRCTRAGRIYAGASSR